MLQRGQWSRKSSFLQGLGVAGWRKVLRHSVSVLWSPASVTSCFAVLFPSLGLILLKDKLLNLTYRICTPRITTQSIQFSKGHILELNWKPWTPGNQFEIKQSVDIPITTRKGLSNDSERGVHTLKNSIRFYVQNHRPLNDVATFVVLMFSGKGHRGGSKTLHTPLATVDGTSCHWVTNSSVLGIFLFVHL